MKKSNISKVGDLTDLANELYKVFENHGFSAPAMAIAFTLPPDYEICHWVTNVSREDGIEIFRNTATKMVSQTN